jgi:hypothetical protein
MGGSGSLYLCGTFWGSGTCGALGLFLLWHDMNDGWDTISLGFSVGSSVRVIGSRADVYYFVYLELHAHKSAIRGLALP